MRHAQSQRAVGKKVRSSPAAVAAVMVVLTLVAASCGDTDSSATTTTAVAETAGTTSETTTTQATTTTTPPTTATLETTTTSATTTTTEAETDPVTASAPPPVSFGDVDDAYESAVADILTAGRDVVERFLADDFESLFAQFDEAMAQQAPVDVLRAGKAQLESEAPLGAPGDDRGLQLSAAARVYQADIEWGDGTIGLTAGFNTAGQINILFLAPRTPLGEDPASEYVSSVEYRLPFEGLWFVAWGGDTELQNYHVVAPDQRHALDILVWKDGASHTGDGTANEDYWAYGQAVLAPADGTVVTVVDGLPDHTPQVGRDPLNPAGNHVVIEVAEAEYVLLAHMQAGSITVAEGDTVERGQEIGLVGNSGNTSEPHIHIHVQDQPVFDPTATGLPIVFTDYVANGGSVGQGSPVGDEFVVNGG